MIPVGPDEDEIELTGEELQYLADRRNVPCPVDGETWEPLTEEELRLVADRRNVDYLRRLGSSDEEIFRLTEEELRKVADRRNVDYLRWLGLTDEEIARHDDRTSAEWMMGPCPNYDTLGDQTSKPEKVEPTRSVIDLPHSLDPEEKKRVGYPLSQEDEEEILRRSLKRTEQRLREYPTIIVFPASPEQRAATLKELKHGKPAIEELVRWANERVDPKIKVAGLPLVNIETGEVLKGGSVALELAHFKMNEKKPDLGLSIHRLGYKPGLSYNFYGIVIVNIDFFAPRWQSVTVDFPVGDMIYAVSFDFDASVEVDIYAKLPPEERLRFRGSISDRTLPFRARLPRPVVLQVVESYLGEVQDEGDGHSFVPFVIKRVNDPTETPVEMQPRQLVFPGIVRGHLAR